MAYSKLYKTKLLLGLTYLSFVFVCVGACGCVCVFVCCTDPLYRFYFFIFLFERTKVLIILLPFQSLDNIVQSTLPQFSQCA